MHDTSSWISSSSTARRLSPPAPTPSSNRVETAHEPHTRSPRAAAGLCSGDVTETRTPLPLLRVGPVCPRPGSDRSRSLPVGRARGEKASHAATRALGRCAGLPWMWSYRFVHAGDRYAPRPGWSHGARRRRCRSLPFSVKRRVAEHGSRDPRHAGRDARAARRPPHLPRGSSRISTVPPAMSTGFPTSRVFASSRLFASTRR